jgi:hypothetical protein
VDGVQADRAASAYDRAVHAEGLAALLGSLNVVDRIDRIDRIDRAAGAKARRPGQAACEGTR